MDIGIVLVVLAAAAVAAVVWRVMAKTSGFTPRTVLGGYIVIAAVLLAAGLALGKGSAYDEPLVKAAYAGNLDQVNELLSKGASPSATSGGRTATCAALLGRHEAVAALLIDRGGDASRPCDGRSMMKVAIEADAWEVVNRLRDRGVK